MHGTCIKIKETMVKNNVPDSLPFLILGPYSQKCTNFNMKC